jgi:hypothetical protein
MARQELWKTEAIRAFYARCNPMSSTKIRCRSVALLNPKAAIRPETKARLKGFLGFAATDHETITVCSATEHDYRAVDFFRNRNGRVTTVPSVLPAFHQ